MSIYRLLRYLTKLFKCTTAQNEIWKKDHRQEEVAASLKVRSWRDRKTTEIRFGYHANTSYSYFSLLNTLTHKLTWILEGGCWPCEPGSTGSITTMTGFCDSGAAPCSAIRNFLISKITSILQGIPVPWKPKVSNNVHKSPPLHPIPPMNRSQKEEPCFE